MHIPDGPREGCGGFRIYAANCRGKGSSAVARWLLRGLDAASPDREWIAWVPPAYLRHTDLRQARLVPTSVAGWVRALWEPLIFNYEVRRRRVGAVLALGDMVPPGLEVPVAVLTQQAFLAYPLEKLDFPLGAAWTARLTVMGGYLRAGLPGVAIVVTQTRHMKEAFCERWGFPEERVRIIPTPAVDPPAEYWLPDQEHPYVLVVVATPRYKNSRIVPEAAAILGRKKGVRWVLTGSQEEHPWVARAAWRKELAGTVEFRGGLSRSALLEMMRRASAVLVSSFLESYGLPYLEAMSMGVPLIVSDRPFAREMCGDAALYADPHDPAEWAYCVDRILTDSLLANELSEAGQRRFAEHWFPPEEGARRFLAVLEEAYHL